ncbi:MAG: bifunctional phosphopantothenoylcysteine decarboxylase/phosphopantothenate--cysteine ligase CoaBC [Thermodesulfobacteriota bacterium]
MTTQLSGKRIIVGVTGSIAAFKVAGWVSSLVKEEVRVKVIMTESAARFVAPLTFGAISGEPVHTNLFGEEEHGISHIELAREADLVLLAPATAQTIGRLAHGLADDLLATTILATKAKVVICPAMNSNMYLHPATQRNLETLKSYGYHVVDPDVGTMACREEGPGRLPEWDVVRESVLASLTPHDLEGRKVLISAGPTREALDPARFLSNRSSGKMGYALARAARRRGAEVTLVSGPTSLETPPGIHRVAVQSGDEMYQQIMAHCDGADIVIKSAAVSDFRPKNYMAEKVKKETAALSIELEQTKDILKELGRLKEENGYFLVGFAAESSDIIAQAKKKLEGKNLDLIVVNDIKGLNTGFEVDTNQVHLVDRDTCRDLPLTTKEHTAELIFDDLVRRLNTVQEGQ